MSTKKVARSADHGCYRHNEATSSSAKRKPDFVKFGTNPIKKVAKYSGERRMNDYILIDSKSK